MGELVDRKRVLFVCVENANRSQMAEAFARIHGGDGLEAFSAGSRPSGRINPAAIASMRELDYDLSSHLSKSLSQVPDVAYDRERFHPSRSVLSWLQLRLALSCCIADPLRGRLLRPPRHACLADAQDAMRSMKTL